jgi:hypothetical protein
METVLHTFSGGPDGTSSVSPVLLLQGAVYGTTEFGGTHTCPQYNMTCGAVFQVLP